MTVPGSKNNPSSAQKYSDVKFKLFGLCDVHVPHLVPTMIMPVMITYQLQVEAVEGDVAEMDIYIYKYLNTVIAFLLQ